MQTWGKIHLHLEKLILQQSSEYVLLLESILKRAEL